MNKYFAFLLSISVFTTFSLEAAVYKGQREFVKQCVKCHKTGQAFVSTKRKREWKALMKNKGEDLASLHIKSSEEKAEKSHDYFGSQSFAKKSKHLQQFLIEYAKDSGNVPACN